MQEIVLYLAAMILLLATVYLGVVVVMMAQDRYPKAFALTVWAVVVVAAVVVALALSGIWGHPSEP